MQDVKDDTPDSFEIVDVLKAQIRRIDMDLDINHRFAPSPRKQRQRAVLEHIRDEYMDRCRS